MDYSILGSILGPPILGNYHISICVYIYIHIHIGSDVGILNVGVVGGYY